MQLTAKSFLENDNLRDEYEMLYADIPKSIPFARIALGKEPDAINFWLGKLIAYSTNKASTSDFDRKFKNCDCHTQGSL
jgi:jumonji domain-containing protein 7